MHRPDVLIRLARVVVVVVVVVGMKWLVTRIEPAMVFFPTRGESTTPDAVGIEYRDLAVRTTDGETLVAWWMPHADARADVVYFHGNGGNLSGWVPVLAGIHAAGLNVLAIDYRGYGRSTGTPSEQGLYRDADAVVAELRRRRAAGRADDRNHPGWRPVIYWGRSLGGAVAAYAASRAAPDGLILESTFADKRAVIRHSLVLRTLDLLASYRFETAAMLCAYTGPTLVMHGDADTVVPYAAGRELFDGLAGPKQFLRLAGDHNDLHPATDREYWNAVAEFVARARSER